jgi:hypothetical protein
MPGPRNSPKAFSDWYESDYFRRPRRPALWTAAVIIAMAVTAAAVGYSFRHPRAYQAGPLSEPHAFLVDNCAACHTAAFATANRLLPGHADDRSVPDEACLNCHQAGVHHPDQTRFVGPTGPAGQSAADCAGCHREHTGAATIAKLEDKRCTECHADLQTASGEHRFAQQIRSFDDHPEFGAWRGKPLSDPGTLKFNHKVHLDLAKNFDADPNGRNAWMADSLNRLKELTCTACHEPDADRRYIRAVSYDRHCAGCHPLTVPAEPTAPLLHPKPGESAEAIRAQLLERFWKQIASQKPAAVETPAAGDRPAVLTRSLPPLSAEEKARVQKFSRDSEGRLFDPAGGDVLSAAERSQFHMQSGCAYCHEESTTPATRRDGLPVYKAPGLRDRWKDMPLPHERFGPAGHRTAAEQISRDRWFPFARFSHESHRMLDCVGCHIGADESKLTSDVLMPNKAICVNCHNQSAAGVRSDCLECHNYHDRAAEPRGLQGRMTVEKALEMTRPGGGAK